jgi:opacity protein-like surface antigen
MTEPGIKHCMRGHWMFKRSGLLAVTLFLFTSLGLSQDGGRFDASFNGAPIFTKESEGNGIRQSATIGGNYFGTFRYKFKFRHSLIFNYGRAKNSQVFQSNFDYHVLTNISEISGAWVYSPFKPSKFEPFFLVGAAALGFSPRSTWVVLPEFNGEPNNLQIDLNAKKQTKAALMYGVGVDYHLPLNFAIRLQYRGFFYSNPDFNVNMNTGSAVSFVTTTKGHMAEPSIGVVFRF